MSRRRPGHRLAAVSAICGIVCLAGSGPALGADTFDGTYTGTRVLTKGSDQTCPVSEAVSTTIHGEAVTFTDGDHRNFVIGFSPHADGTFSQISAGIEGGVVLISGRIAGDTIDADVSGGPCEHHWHLTRERRTQ
jgi:hypothetical protein